MALSRELFEASAERCGGRLRAWLLSRAPSREDADEVLQRTFECAWRKRERFTGTDPLPWLFAIASLELKYYRRSRSYEESHASDSLERLLDHTLDAADPERMHDALERYQQLQTCLEKLDPVNRRILALFHGLELSRGPGKQSTPLDEVPPSSSGPLSDAEVALQFDAGDGRPWSPARIKMRRHRAYEQLQRCHQAGEETDAQEKGFPTSTPAYSEEIHAMHVDHRQAKHPSGHQLLEFSERSREPARAPVLESTLDTSLEPVHQHLEHCAECQERLEGMLDVIDALSIPDFMRSLATIQSLTPPPLSEKTLKRLQSIEVKGIHMLRAPVAAPPDSSASTPTLVNLQPLHLVGRTEDSSGSEGVSRRATSPGSRSWVSRFAAPSLALAASLLLVMGIWSRRDPSQPAQLDTGSGEVLRGEAGTSQTVPARVILRRAGKAETELLEPTRMDTGEWRVRVPIDAAIQLRLMAPIGAQAWTASVSCTRPEHGLVPLEPGNTRWSGTGTPASPELVVGRPLNLAALSLKPGERLTCSVQRGADTSLLVIEFGP